MRVQGIPSLVRAHLEAGEFEEVVLLGDVQQMILDVGVHLGQHTAVSHGAGKVTEGDGALGIHLRQQVVPTDLYSREGGVT